MRGLSSLAPDKLRPWPTTDFPVEIKMLDNARTINVNLRKILCAHKSHIREISYDTSAVSNKDYN